MHKTAKRVLRRGSVWSGNWQSILTEDKLELNYATSRDRRWCTQMINRHSASLRFEFVTTELRKAAHFVLLEILSMSYSQSNYTRCSAHSNSVRTCVSYRWIWLRTSYPQRYASSPRLCHVMFALFCIWCLFLYASFFRLPRFLPFCFFFSSSPSTHILTHTHIHSHTHTHTHTRTMNYPNTRTYSNNKLIVFLNDWIRSWCVHVLVEQTEQLEIFVWVWHKSRRIASSGLFE